MGAAVACKFVSYIATYTSTFLLYNSRVWSQSRSLNNAISFWSTFLPYSIILGLMMTLKVPAKIAVVHVYEKPELRWLLPQVYILWDAYDSANCYLPRMYGEPMGHESTQLAWRSVKHGVQVVLQLLSTPNPMLQKLGTPAVIDIQTKRQLNINLETCWY